MKRYLSLFLAAAVLISCLTITVFADDGREENANAFNGSFVDMLPAKSYYFYRDNELLSSREKPIYTINPKGTKYQISWDPFVSGTIQGVNFCLYSGVLPDSVQFLRADGLANTATLVKSVGSYRYYTFMNSQPFEYARLSVIANYSSSTTVNFGLINFFGVLPDSKPINYGTFSSSMEYTLNSQTRVESIKSAQNVSFPYSFTHNDEFPFLTVSTLKIPAPGSNMNSLSINFTSVGSVILGSGFSCGIYKNGKLVCMLPVSLVEGYGASVDLDGNNMGKALLYSYTGNIDLSGVDLSGCEIWLKIEVVSWESVDFNFFKLNIQNVAYKENIYIVPWYREFYNWISGVMNRGYQSIVDAIKGDDNSDMNQATDQMEVAANDLKESSDAFEQVETPDIDAGALTGDLTNFSVSGLAVLGVITANPYVTSLLVLVFTFALCAYIFFGKKG